MMDCNKEEAIRAKGIAESKMQSKDFFTARRLALKAQQLYKDVENVSQMLTVCDVHCAADKKLFGNEMDWYGILQLGETADELLIRKQYRKFALQLHPDKNKFPGAEAAFKLIGEAQRVLLDKGKRSLHDIKRKSSTNKPAPPYRASQNPAYSQNFGVQNNYGRNFTGFNSQHQQSQHQAQRVFSNGRLTFWTACPFCSVKYQYYIEVLNRTLGCQTCGKSFVAYEKSGLGPPTAANFSQPVFSQRKDVPTSGVGKVEPGHQRNRSAGHSNREFVQKKVISDEIGSAKENCKQQSKQGVESSESCDSESSADTEEDMLIDEDGDFKAKRNFDSYGDCLRRSDRHRQPVSYKENVSDDDEEFMSHPKKVKWGGSSCSTEEQNGNGLKEDASENNKHLGQPGNAKEENEVKWEKVQTSLPNKVKETESVESRDQVEVNGFQENFEAPIDPTTYSSVKSTSETKVYLYADPEFRDFDKGRNAECFSEGQIWAVYDTLDGMPRFYARIKKRAISPGFKLQITWLEPDPGDKNEIEWVHEGLPTSCGKFRHGETEHTEDQLTFSHLVHWEKGSRKWTYKIFPRKGETWALFKNWNIKWISEAETNRKYDYEFVEVLSDYTEEAGVCIRYLAKAKGFVSVFGQICKDTFQILPSELFRFSHMVPSFKLTGGERKGVPKGSFELDPASLPQNIEEFDVPEYLGVELGSVCPFASCTNSPLDKLKHEVLADVKGVQLGLDSNLNAFEDCSRSSTSLSDDIEIPEGEFFNFDSQKSIEKFRVGQIWSLYSKEDGLPKYYGEIKKIDSDQDFTVHVRWLENCSPPEEIIQWHDEDMLIGCGRFQIKRGRSNSESYTSTGIFSHQMTAVPTGKKDEYYILPRKGDVWALYRNWSPEIEASELENCQYDIVEVLEENDSKIKVLFLDRVDGFNAVFRPKLKGGSAVTMQVLRTELLRFSHQIPAFRLTEEKAGSLRGFCELDPAALPLYYFATN
uniref:J domain-containing protein n=1 Tax=Rhizophora mucronata TaxID=61149 RepID=A0A2P2MY67_RHIMU